MLNYLKAHIMKNIAILASGSGTNAENIIKYFSNSNSAEVALVLSNKRDAYVLERAAKHGIPAGFFDRAQFYSTGEVLNRLLAAQIDFIVLAGFLWLVPKEIIEAYPRRIINIHPALLPAYGGKGMFGEHVHEIVIKNGDRESGITIHYVNEVYDSGDVILQVRCRVEGNDTAESLAHRVHQLEYRYFPEVIKKLVEEIA